MSDFAPPTIAPQNIAPAQDDGSGTVPPVPEAPEPAPITEQEVGEYREQDRFLPVRLSFSSYPALHPRLTRPDGRWHAPHSELTPAPVPD